MSKLSKVLWVVFLLGACTVTDTPIDEKEDPKFPEPVGLVSSPDTGESIPNPITIEVLTTNTPQDQNHTGYCTYPVITAMQDVDLKTKINETLKSSVLFYCENLTKDKIPQFQGLKAFFGRDPYIRQRFVQSSVTYNENNILSIMVTIELNVGNKKESIRVRTLKGINIDLTTGNPVTIPDLFINGYDYEKVINAVILDHTSRHWYEPGEIPFGTIDNSWTGYGNTEYVMNYGFQGIRPTQGFIISAEGVQMIFDETTPEFNCQIGTVDDPYYFAFTINAPYPADGVAIKQRFTK